MSRGSSDDVDVKLSILSSLAIGGRHLGTLRVLFLGASSARVRRKGSNISNTTVLDENVKKRQHVRGFVARVIFIRGPLQFMIH